MYSIGCDVIELERIKEAYARQGERFLETLFTSSEIQYIKKHNDPHPIIAGRFAAKEAIAKALETGIGENLGWLDIEITNDEKGAPRVKLSSKATPLLKKSTLKISISHTHLVAMAVALISPDVCV